MDSFVRPAFLLAAAVFFVSAAFGYGFAFLSPQEADRIVRETLDRIRYLQDVSLPALFLFIMFNNAAKAFLAMVAGVFFGIAPFLFVVVNGYAVGLFVRVAEGRQGWLVVAASLLPHGVLELSAIFLAAAYGFLLGRAFWRTLRGGSALGPIFLYACGQYFRIVLPLLVAAALVEALVTPRVILLVR
jgi:stage II sporulation protein M